MTDMSTSPSISESPESALRSLLAARSNEPKRRQYQAFFDAALDTLRKGSPGLAEPSRVALSRSIALQCQGAALGNGLRPMSEAKKDRTRILAKVHDNLYPNHEPEREDLVRWNGVWVVIHHNGLAGDSYDIGWGVSAPVGHGGLPDEWFEGWVPLPDATALGDELAREDKHRLNPNPTQQDQGEPRE